MKSHGGIVIPALPHFRNHVEWLSLPVGHREQVFVHIGRYFARPDRRCNNQRINTGKVGFARFDGRLFSQESFHPADRYVVFFERFDPDQFCIHRSARAVATFCVCPLHEKYAIRTKTPYIDTKNSRKSLIPPGWSCHRHCNFDQTQIERGL